MSGIQQVSENLVGGRLRFFLPFWKKLTSDENIIQIISGAKLEFKRCVRQKYPCKPINISTDFKCKIEQELQKYLVLGIIEKTDHSAGEFVNQIFPISKKNGGIRIILNLKLLNVDLQYKHFKMENLNSALCLMKKNCFMTSIDLKDAYYSVNIHESCRKFLRFVWNDQLFQFTCLPNGLSSAPRWYTKLMKPIFSKLRNQGFISVYYLDDIWLMGETRLQCQINLQVTISFLQEAGFLINFEKSCIVPTQYIKFLGFHLDSVNMTVNLPSEKKENIAILCKNLLTNNELSVRDVAKVIGVLVSCLPAIRYGALFYRYLERDKIIGLRANAGNFDGKMKISSNGKSDLQWWLCNVSSSIMPIKVPSYSLVITTDASHVGWGAVSQGQSTGGHWTTEESNLHINELELKAILFGLKSFFDNITARHIRIKSDNFTAVSYINNLGGVKSIKLHNLAKSIWTWAFSRDIHLSAEHLPGS